MFARACPSFAPRMLRQSEERSLEHIAKLNLVYRSGADSSGRPVVVVMVGHLPPYEVSMEDVVMYLYRVIEDIVESEYSVLLVNGPLSTKNTPSFGRIAHAIRVLPRSYVTAISAVFGRFPFPVSLHDDSTPLLHVNHAFPNFVALSLIVMTPGIARTASVSTSCTRTCG
jgi:hypothetical protein